MPNEVFLTALGIYAEGFKNYVLPSFEIWLAPPFFTAVIIMSCVDTHARAWDQLQSEKFDSLANLLLYMCTYEIKLLKRT